MNYELLKNKVYLTLLAYYDKKQLKSFSELGKMVGITRQTASTRYKELIDKKLIFIDEEKNINVNNVLNIDPAILKNYLDVGNFDPVFLKTLLFPKDNQTKVELAKELGLARSSLYLDNHSVVYGIQSEGKIKYIGTTAHYENRIATHIKKRPFLTPSNFIILADNPGQDKFNIELELIHLLKPEWNEMGTEIN